MKNIIYFTFVILSYSCVTKANERKSEEILYHKILLGKTIEKNSGNMLDSGYTNYLLAFDDGHTERTSFGYYNCLQIGDTVEFYKIKGDSDFWIKMRPKCK